MALHARSALVLVSKFNNQSPVHLHALQGCFLLAGMLIDDDCLASQHIDMID